MWEMSEKTGVMLFGPLRRELPEEARVPIAKSVLYRPQNMQGLWAEGLRDQEDKTHCPYFEKYNWKFLMGVCEESKEPP